MRNTLITLATAALLALGTAAASAQSSGYTGPSNVSPRAATQGVYSGPSTVPLMTIRQLLDSGRDDQPARLQGRIISHDGGDRYTFKDETGHITAEIDHEDFPVGRTVGAEDRVELVGELDKGFRKTEFEVDRVILLR